MRGMTRHVFKPKSYELTTTDEALADEICSDPTGCIAMGFAGKRMKPDFHFRFSSPQKATGHVATWLDRLRGAAKLKAERQAERKAYRHTLSSQAGRLAGTSIRTIGKRNLPSLARYPLSQAARSIGPSPIEN